MFDFWSDPSSTSFFMCATSSGSGETARISWAFAGRLCDRYQNLMCWLRVWYVDIFFSKVRVFQFKNVFGGSCNRSQSNGWHVDVVMQRSRQVRRLCLLYLINRDIATTSMHAKWITNPHCICKFYCRWDGFGLTFIRNSWMAKQSNRLKTKLSNYWIIITRVQFLYLPT